MLVNIKKQCPTLNNKYNHIKLGIVVPNDYLYLTIKFNTLKRIEIMADNNYTLRYSGSIEEIKAKGYSLESALDRKGIIFNSIQQDNSRNPNGKYIVHLSGGGRMYATWLEKKVLRM